MRNTPSLTFSVKEPFELRLLGPDVAKHQDIVNKKLAPVESIAQVGGKLCIFSAWEPTTRKMVWCDRQAERGLNRHGWLCRDHQLTVKRVEGRNTVFVWEVDAGTIKDDCTHGLRFNHFHLMRAAIYRADGSPKFEQA